METQLMNITLDLTFKALDREVEKVDEADQLLQEGK